MEEEMGGVSYLTINGETREIVDSKSRDDISLLQAQINYLAAQLNIDISEIDVE
jgi:hypothetical protein